MNRFLHSFRWQLQAWHSLLLLIALVPFCATAVFLQHHTVIQRIDDGLRRRAAVILDQVNPDAQGRRPLQKTEMAEKLAGPHRDHDGRFDEGFESEFYHVVWAGDRIVARSTNAPAELLAGAPPSRVGVERARNRGSARELVLPGPHGLHTLVGRDVRRDIAHARAHAWWLIGAGAGVLLAGIAGDWWIARRAIRPIIAIGATAEKIAGGNLDERIDAGHFATEFGPLAQTLNHTFDRLQAMLQRQVQFTADASHELRTPVAVTLLTSQSALGRERSAAEYREALETCERAAQRMRQLVESLLLLARLDAHDDRASHRAIELGEVIGPAVALLEPLTAKLGVTIELALSPSQVSGDADQMAQVVSNLVSNAVYHSPRGATVRVGLVSRADAAILTVVDQGEGIAPDDLPHIFDRFYRADKSRRRSEGRTGLGLAISKAIVESHRGRIDVDSHLGQGSTFTVVLPISETTPVSL